MEPQRGKGSENALGWLVCRRFSPELAILYKTAGNQKSYAPLYVHSFRVVSQKCRKAEATNQLQYLRLQTGLLQRQVAERIGISESAYREVELGRSGRLPADVVDKLVKLYGMPVEEWLDGYNLFLYRGQARQLRAYRQAHGLSQKELAAVTGLGESSIREWERGKKTMSRRSWEKWQAFLLAQLSHQIH